MKKDVLRQIEKELLRQEALWGKAEHEPPVWVSILAEEVGEVAKACNQHNAAQMREELIQVAATAIAAIEGLKQFDDAKVENS